MSNMQKIDKENVEDVLSLTHTQEGMLFHYLTEGSSEQYFEQLSVTLEGRLDVRLLQNAWDHLAQTNEMLRTVFRWENVSKPVQIVLKEHLINIVEHDISGDRKEIQEKLIHEIRENDRKAGIDISVEPFRILLVKLNENCFEMIISNHHILFDGWSTGILLKEFFETYEALVKGSQLKINRKTKFKEYAKWLQKLDKNHQAEYWRSYLAEFETNAEIPVDYRDKGKECITQNHPVKLSEDLLNLLESIAKKHQITLASLLYTAWGILIQRYSNSNDVVFGSTVSGRTPEIKGIENIVGLFINTIPLRVKLKDKDTIIDLIKRVDIDLKERGEFESTPLVDIKSYADYKMKGNFFNSIVVIENYPLDAGLSEANGSIKVVDYSTFEMTNFDLNLGISIFKGLSLNFVYNANSFNPETIAAIADHYINILGAITKDCNTSVALINLMSEHETRQILHDFSNTKVDYPKEKTISCLFSEQAVRTPNQIAAKYKGQSITYKQLDKKATQLANLLREMGVKENVVVGTYVERSIEMMIAVVAIMKSGGVYLPLDSDYPSDRISFMLSDSKTHFLLTGKGLPEDVTFDGEIIHISDQRVYDNEPILFEDKCLPDDPAYIIYTSGTTGMPKGVRIRNRSLVNLCCWYKETYHINESSKVLSMIPCGFDASIKNMITPLIAGGQTILAPAGYFDPKAILETIKDNKVTLINCVPSAIYPVVSLAEKAGYNSLSSLEYLLLGGEAMTFSYLEPWLGKDNCSCILGNIYGPTECTDISTAYSVSKQELKHSKTVPIGKPINNMKAYVLNSFYQPQPVGIPGQLCISGDGVAIDYLGRPDLTKDKFTPNPFIEGELLYKTGDLARWCADGNIEFLGRIDNQVKIRGHRIELAEIENQVNNYSGVSEAVVICKDDDSGNKSLFVYLISNKPLELPDLKEHLSRNLPGYMIPDYYAVLEQFPLTANGKIDKNALKSIEVRTVSRTEFIAPGNEVELELVEIWQSLLGNKKIGIRDNFFDIGGNSILLVQMYAKIEKIHPGVLTVTDLFSYPTITKLSEFIIGSAGKINEKIRISDHLNKEETGKEIAIIGIAAKLPMANGIEEFWYNLKNGIDCVRTIPDSRKQDILNLPYFAVQDGNEAEFSEGAYLDEIDKFDCNYFRISPKEASLMDPNQRMFLETAWSAIEDAGYGGEKITGSRTGVFVGFGSDAEYKRFIMDTDPSLLSFSVSGNVKPIIASRLSFLKDFRGPSLIVDTTCSSSLMAVHLACNSIRNGECEMAVAGSSQIHFLPVRQAKIGVESSDGRAKTFDDMSDGTGAGEGVIAILLKPLSKAEKDGDHIYAVIKGSAANHDGHSIGITAPNAIAQEDVIINAWKDAEVDPETISYIEAHGTGTKLGDPIEIDGIQKAFKRFTDRRQFCAVGSVKTNIGHLDSSAGLAGLLKNVLLLKNKQLVPSLHFKKPNRKINFEESPVYVNDSLTDWIAEDFPRRCGISSFGLSGTNCHIVLEEAPVAREQKDKETDAPNVLTLSAKSEKSFKELISRTIRQIERVHDCSLRDICYTSNTGRGHYEIRLALLVKDKEDLLKKLREISISDFVGKTSPELYFGKHRVISVNDEINEPGDITEHEINNLTKKADMKLSEFGSNNRNENLLNEICELYISGAEVKWSGLYNNENRKRVSLPTYAFEKKRCWLDIKSGIKSKKEYIGNQEHPLLDKCIAESMNLEVFSTQFSVDRHWVLDEHRIDGNCVLVGTTYLEMALEACKKIFSEKVQLTDIQFITPLVVKTEEEIEVQLVLEHNKGGCQFYIVSRHQAPSAGNDVNWIKHVEGKVCNASETKTQKLEIDLLKAKYKDGYIIPDYESYMESTVFEFGPRWRNLKEMYIGQKELIAKIEMPEAFRNELSQFRLHPALLDNALATVPMLNRVLGTRQSDKANEDIFLPFSYKRINLYHPFTPECYSYVRIKNDVSEQAEIINFDITMADKDGNVFLEIEDYSLKRAQKAKLKVNAVSDEFYEIEWIKQELEQKSVLKTKTDVLVIKDEKGFGEEIIERLKNEGIRVIDAEVRESNTYSKLQEDKYLLNGTQEDYNRLISEIGKGKPLKVLHLLSMSKEGEIDSLYELGKRKDAGVNSLFRLSKALLGKKNIMKTDIILISDPVTKVTGLEKGIYPENAAMLGLGKVLGMEYPNLKLKFIEVDEETKVKNFFDELWADSNAFHVVYRNSNRYVEQLRQCDLGSKKAEEITLKSEGVTIITGGFGGIGLEIGKHLAARSRGHLAFISRSELPDRSEWAKILEDKKDTKTVKRIAAIQQMEEFGSTVLCYSADVSQEDAMKKVIDGLRAEYGRINGVIHCAGIAGDGFVIRKDEAAFNKVLSPKVEGTWLLDKLTQSDEPDFFILFSSCNTLMGMPGQGDYTAANSYLDSFSQYRNLNGKRTLAINWTGWKETGMAVDYGVNKDNILKTISTRDALEAFDKVFSLDMDKVIIGQINYSMIASSNMISNLKLELSEDIKLRINKEKNKANTAGNQMKSTLTGVVGLKGKAGQEYSEIEKNIALMWKEVLGFDEFNINDNFFEIGGDSILITKVHSRIEERYPGKIQLGDLFSYTTISKISQFISRNDVKKEDKKQQVIQTDEEIENNILALFEDVEKGKISLDEANQIMDSWGAKK
jgi:amino acid adenylation domain-containing protein